MKNLQNKEMSSKYHVLILAILMVFNYLWFSNFSNFMFTMDDPFVINDFADSTKTFFEHTFSNTVANRYRPIFALFQYLELEIFGKNYASIVFFNIGFNGFIIITLYYLALKITKNNIVPFLLSIIYLTSRFSYYNIAEFNGILESLSIFFLLIIIAFSIKFWKERKSKYYFIVLLFYCFIVFTHERYIVLSGFIIFMILLTNFLTTKQKIIYSFFPLLILSFNIFLKKIILGIPFFVGTGSAHQMGFSLKQSILHYMQSLLNIVGYNNGPNYLNGYTVVDMTQGEVFVVSVVLLSSFLIFVGFIYQCRKYSKQDKVNETKIFLIFLSAFLLIILSFSLTIRAEERWLYAPYILYILYLGYIVNKQKSKVILSVFIIFVGTSVYMDNIYKKHENTIFFIGAKIDGKAKLDATVGKYGKLLEKKEIFIVSTNSDLESFMKIFIKANSNIETLNINTISSPHLIKNINANTLVYTVVNGILVEMPLVFPKNFKEARLLSGMYVLTGGEWISKEVSGMLNSGNGKLKGKIYMDNEIRLPNKISIFINDKIYFSKDIVNLGYTSFEFDYTPNQNILVKVMLDKAIIPAELGLGADLRELSTILKELYFDIDKGIPEDYEKAQNEIKNNI